jgi:predicted AAA+ superfamily ATPase
VYIYKEEVFHKLPLWEMLLYLIAPLNFLLTLADKKITLPNIYIIAGCNGAGKTTASFTILPEMLDCKEFVNADEIARGLSPFQP